MSKCKVTFRGPRNRSPVARSLRSPQFQQRVVKPRLHTERDSAAMREALEAVTEAFGTRHHFHQGDDE